MLYLDSEPNLYRVSRATAYLAFQKCNPKSGETILISSAAGAVGHIVGQLAKLKVRFQHQ